VQKTRTQAKATKGENNLYPMVEGDYFYIKLLKSFFRVWTCHGSDS